MSRFVILGNKISTDNPLFRKYLLSPNRYVYTFSDEFGLVEVLDYSSKPMANLVFADDFELIDKPILIDFVQRTFEFMFVDDLILNDGLFYYDTDSGKFLQFSDVVQFDEHEFVLQTIGRVHKLHFADSLTYVEPLFSEDTERKKLVRFTDVVYFEEPEPVIQRPEKNITLNFTEQLIFNEPQ